jgi:gamma-glutamylcyclotransferase (GGCT)/AIG2-like uncharacterized protein YtfP
MTERRRTTGSFEAMLAAGSRDALDRLFVYGTMRQGQTARSILANSIVRTVPASTYGRIYSFPMGYPGFVEGEGTVIGEVAWLTDLAGTFALLDAYEGQDFARVIRKVQPAEGPELWAWIYVLADPGAVSLGQLIEDGDWVRFWTAEQA